MGFGREKQDIAQEYIKRVLEGRHAHALIDQAAIDIIRIWYGRLGTKAYRQRRAIDKGALIPKGFDLDGFVYWRKKSPKKKS